MSKSFKSFSNAVTVVLNPETKTLITPMKVEAGKTPRSYIRLEQSALDANGNFRARVALMKGDHTFIENTVSSMALVAGDILPGKIIRQESFEPFTKNQKPATEGKGGAISKIAGKPYYMRYVYTEDMSAVDTLLSRNAVAVAEPVTQPVAEQIG